jgi:hypothetical protein
MFTYTYNFTEHWTLKSGLTYPCQLQCCLVNTATKLAVLYNTYSKTTVKEKDITLGPSKAPVKTKHPIRTVTSSNNFNTKRKSGISRAGEVSRRNFVSNPNRFPKYVYIAAA